MLYVLLCPLYHLVRLAEVRVQNSLHILFHNSGIKQETLKFAWL